MDSQVLVALALSLVGGLSTSLGEFIESYASSSRAQLSILEFQCSHFVVLVFDSPNSVLGITVYVGFA